MSKPAGCAIGLALVLLRSVYVAAAPPTEAPLAEEGPPVPSIADSRLESLPLLQPGETIAGVIETSDPPMSTDALAGELDAGSVGRGRSFHIRVSEDGPHTIEMRSHFFDSYLVLRDSSGTVLAQEDDGLFHLHARLGVPDLQAGHLYRLDACALDDGVGAFEVRVVPGKPRPLSDAEYDKAATDDARRRIEAVEKALGPEHPSTATSLNVLAMLLHDQGDYGRARPLLERALRIRETSLGPEHEETTMSLNDLAMTLHRLGDLEGARALHQRCLRIRETSDEPDPEGIAASLCNLAALLADLGEFEEALSLFERALRVCDASFDPDHEASATINVGLATLHHDLGHYSRAQEHCACALRSFEILFGPDHPNTAAALYNLATLLRDKGDYRRAQELCEQALGIFESSLGPTHPHTVQILRTLAGLDER